MRMDIREKGVTFLSSSVAATGRRAPRENNLNFILPQGTEFVDAHIIICAYVYYILHTYMFLFFIITFINSVHLYARIRVRVRTRNNKRARRRRGKEYTRCSGKKEKKK